MAWLIASEDHLLVKAANEGCRIISPSGPQEGEWWVIRDLNP